jgi:hypothetical protein
MMKMHGLAMDITGDRYAKLVAIESVKSAAGYQGILWLFRCDCGNMTIARLKDVRRGNTKSCGCANTARRVTCGTTRKPGIKRGDVFGELTVTKLARVDNGKRFFHCRCSCGGKNTVRSAILVNGQVRSCGHLRTTNSGRRQA